MKSNVLFFLIDSFRADKCNGDNKTSITPNIDNLIKNGVFFSQAISSSSATVQSLATICTGLYPFNAGVSGMSYREMSWKARSYFEDFKENGYNIIASVPEFASSVGLKTHFKRKYKPYHNVPMLFDGLGHDIIKFLDSEKLKEPWFLFLHFLDLHYLVWLPDEFKSKKYGINPYERMISAIDVWIGRILEKIDLNKTLVVLTADHGEYVPDITNDEQEIQYEHGIIDRTLWKIGSKFPSSLMTARNRVYDKFQKSMKKIQLASHKTKNLRPYQKRAFLGARGNIGNDFHVYDEILRIPLIFSGFGIHKPKIISQQVRHVDIFPTIAEVIQLPKRDVKINGNSLRPLLDGKTLQVSPVYFESAPGISKPKDQICGLRTTEYKYSRNKDGSNEKAKLFDLQKDPFEENNIAQEKPDIVNKLEKILMEIMNNDLSQDYREEMSKEEAKKIEDELKKLGYI